MRRIARVWGIAVVAGLCLGGTAAHAQTTAGGAQIVSERSLAGNGVELTISTPAFAAPTKVEVYLPTGYDADPGRRWPVTYYLHGMQGDQARFHQWYGDLIRDFPSIVVSPDGGFSGFYSDWYNAGAGGPPEYETFDIQQLLPLIDQRFRTFGTRAERAVIGESMGGYGVMTLATRHPDLFAAAASLSGLVDNGYAPAIGIMSAGPMLQTALPGSIYGPYATQEVRWRGHNPTDLAANLRAVDLQVRTFEGLPNPPYEGGPDSVVGCTEERGIYETNVTFHARLQALGVPHFYKDYGAGCHGIPEFRIEFADSLPGLESVFAHPRPVAKSFSYESIEPRFSVWGWTVAADPGRALEFLRMRHAGRRGLTLVGSGTTRVTTPPYFKGHDTVAVVAPGGTRAVTPDDDGRLTFDVDLGPAHADQQDTPAARLAGDGSPGYFTTASLRFVL
jgi:S-formylglutathione hydrolase FrmB